MQLQLPRLPSTKSCTRPLGASKSGAGIGALEPRPILLPTGKGQHQRMLPSQLPQAQVNLPGLLLQDKGHTGHQPPPHDVKGLEKGCPRAKQAQSQPARGTQGCENFLQGKLSAFFGFAVLSNQVVIF